MCNATNDWYKLQADQADVSEIVWCEIERIKDDPELNNLLDKK